MKTDPVPPLRCARVVLGAAFCLLAAAVLSAQTAPPPPASASTPPRKVEDEEALTLSTFTVLEGKEVGYESMHTASGMRTVQELKNVANSIAIMNSQFIEDLGLLTMEDMATWMVSGESNPDPNATVQSRVILRGIPNAYALRNGWIWYSPMDAYSTERVEELRGPNAFLYGEADVGGAQNQLTKRGVFTRNLTRLKLMGGSWELRRAEIDVNRILLPKQLAVRIAAVQHNNESWINNVRRDFRGIYAAVTYRPFRQTTISAMAEHAKTTAVLSQGLFVDAFSRTGTASGPAGFIYVPGAGLMYRSTGRVISTGPGVGIVDPAVLPRNFHSNGPNSTYKNDTDTFTLEVEQRIGRNLNVQLSGNWYQQDLDNWAVTSRNVTRDRSPLLPNGQPNPYFNELYTEYFRTRNLNGNIVRDVRISAVYDLKTSWMKQQFIVNAQQHQDNPRQKSPKYGEYLDQSHPNWTGTVDRTISQAAFVANRTVFTNNRFLRRYYLRDGVGPDRTGDLGPVPGISAWYPDLSNQIAATGQFIDRRFYTPSWGAGASGSYFKEHLYTMIGYRRDEFNMKTIRGAVRPQQEWVNDYVDTLNPRPFTHYQVDGWNAGAVVRFNEVFAVGYNWAQSFRISVGEGAQTFNAGELQSIPVGEGSDISARLTLLKGKIEISAVHYKNFTPNARFNPPGITQEVRDEVSALFPTTFVTTGQDYQTTTTSGNEIQILANPSRNWRLSFSFSTNKVVNEDRAPLLKAFQAAAKAQNQATPLLDEFLQTIPEGVPNPGYTKERGNIFTRYQFSEGALKGLFVGVGANYRLRTYRGTVNLTGATGAPAINLYSPPYKLYNAALGYQRRIVGRQTTFALNVDNLSDKEYYRSTAIGSGSWGDPRSWKLTISTEL